MRTTPNPSSNQDNSNEHICNSNEVANAFPDGTILPESEGGHEMDLSTENAMETPQKAPHSSDTPQQTRSGRTVQSTAQYQTRLEQREQDLVA